MEFIFFSGMDIWWKIKFKIFKIKCKTHLCLVVVCVCVLVTQSCLTLCNPTDHIPPGSSVHEILQARIVGWVATSFSRRSSQPRDRTRVSCIADRYFTVNYSGSHFSQMYKIKIHWSKYVWILPARHGSIKMI